jgi:hypothetical protein
MAYSKSQLEALKNSLLSSTSDITASEHRQVEQAIIDEMYDAQSRADLFASLATILVPQATDKLFVFRNGVAGLIETSILDFVQNLSQLQDVNIESPLNEAIVHYNPTTQKFEAKTLDQFSISYNANALRDALQGLIGVNRLDASAIKNLPSTTAVQTVNGKTPTLGDVTLDADEIAETATRQYASPTEKAFWSSKYDTPSQVRDALQGLNGNNRLDASAIKNLPAGISGEFLRKNVTLNAHGFVAKDVLTVNSSGLIVKVTNTLTQKAIGVVRSVIDVNTFELVINGFIDGLSGLTVGSIHYSNNSGTLVTTASDVQVLIAISATSGFMLSSGGGALPVDASETVKGVIEIVNQTEAETVDGTVGTLDHVRAMTLRGFRWAWNKMLTVAQNITGAWTFTGANTLITGYALTVVNSAAGLIFRTRNDQSVEFGGSVMEIEVPSAVTAGNGSINFNDLTGEQFALKDKSSNKYLTFEKLASGTRIVRNRRAMVLDRGVGMEVYNDQVSITTTITAAAQNIILTIAIPTGFMLSFKAYHMIAYATDESVVSADDLQVTAKNVSGTVTSAATSLTHQRLPNTLNGSFNTNISGTDFQLRFQNETGTGKTYTIELDFTYTLIARPL